MIFRDSRFHLSAVVLVFLLCAAGLIALFSVLARTFHFIDEVGQAGIGKNAGEDLKLDWQDDSGRSIQSDKLNHELTVMLPIRPTIDSTENVIYREQCRLVTEALLAEPISGVDLPDNNALVIKRAISYGLLQELARRGRNSSGDALEYSSAKAFRCYVESIRTERLDSGLVASVVSGRIVRLRGLAPEPFRIVYLLADSFEDKPVIIDMRYSDNIRLLLKKNPDLLRALQLKDKYDKSEKNGNAGNTGRTKLSPDDRKRAFALAKEAAFALALSSNRGLGSARLEKLKNSLSPSLYEVFSSFRFGRNRSRDLSGDFAECTEKDISEMHISILPGDQEQPDLAVATVRSTVTGSSRIRPLSFYFVLARRTDADGLVLIGFHRLRKTAQVADDDDD